MQSFGKGTCLLLRRGEIKRQGCTCLLLWRGEIKRQKRISEIDLGVILIGGFIGNDQWIYSKHRIRIRWRGEVIGWLTLHLQYEMKEHDIHTKQVKKTTEQ